MNDYEDTEAYKEGGEQKYEAPALTILQCFGLIVLFLILQLITSLLLSRLNQSLLNDTRWINLALTHLVAGLLTAQAGAVLSGISLMDFFRPWRITIPNIILILISVCGITILAYELSKILQSISPMPKFYEDLYTGLFQQNIFGVLFAIGIVAPLTEELLFRGVMLDGLQTKYPMRVAFWVSTSLFAIAHILPWLAVNAFLVGSFFAWVKTRTGSLALCTLAHMLYNSVPFIIEAKSIPIPGLITDANVNALQFQPWWFDLVGAIFLIAGIAGLYFFNKRMPAVVRV